MAYFPGQADRMVFSLDQVKALASPGTNEIFWAFSARTPRSVREIAASLGKRAPAVHYHIATLLDLNLILAVEERKRYARMETLYVRAGVTCVDSVQTAGPEYLSYRVKSFAATMRELTRQTELLYELAPNKPDVWDFEHYWRTVALLTPEQADHYKDRINQIVQEIAALPLNPEGVRVNIAVVMRPTIDQTRKWKQELGPDDTEEEDGQKKK
ncbi:MAG: helix-turn-helix transcriptional regulator [Fimbriimonadaceae bacterium]|nr:helix-turn-helix transcriptional regulator [Fimbriimonadaceae bacterium]